MRLRSYLLIANGVSIGVILIVLFVCYRFMLLDWSETVLLGSVTACAAFISAVVHACLTRPLESSLRRLTDEVSRVAEGNFDGEVPLQGPLEFRQLSAQFTDMSRKLRDSFERLHSSEASRRELVANVSHDLRTPMASIQAFVEALQDDVIHDRETFDRYLRTIRLETRRLDRLIDDLFQLSQLHAEAIVWAPEPCHADSLIVETLQSLSLQIGEKGLEVDVRLPDNLPPLYAMPFELKRVLANLLQNAIHHSPAEGKLRVEVEPVNGEWEEPGASQAAKEAGTSGPEAAVKWMKAGTTKASGSAGRSAAPTELASAGDAAIRTYIRFTIADEGDGISEADQARIFERFYRADRARSRTGGEGAGLGLAIAASIVAMHGGAIGVESEPGCGSRFWFTIPAADEDRSTAG